jgi:hypothetical protein
MNAAESRKMRHDKAAPYWAAALIIMVVIGVSVDVLEFGAFWRGYALDITGPAWSYILVRRLSHAYADNAWTRFFTPYRTLTLIILSVYGIELAQYFRLYDSTYDPWDFLAYVSLLIPVFLVDIRTR